MFAQVSSVQTAADKLAGLVTFAEDRLSAIQEARGFKGFYLLADRHSGEVISIALWDSDDDQRRHEARGGQVREEAESELGIASPPVHLFEVLLQS